MREAIRNSGILDGYDSLLQNLRQKGVPRLAIGDFDDDGGSTADVFEFAAWYLQNIYDEIKARKRAERRLQLEKRRQVI